MIRTKLKTIALLFAPALLLVTFAFAPASANSPTSRSWSDRDQHCVLVGGSLLTNFGALAPEDKNTTLGPATGDLAGAVAATVPPTDIQIAGSTATFLVQHHWVTDSGDTIGFDQATAKTAILSPTRFAIIDYSAHINGKGTGKFAGATGDLNFLGEVDLSAGTALRYFGKVCYADHDN